MYPWTFCGVFEFKQLPVRKHREKLTITRPQSVYPLFVHIRTMRVLKWEHDHAYFSMSARRSLSSFLICSMVSLRPSAVWRSSRFSCWHASNCLCFSNNLKIPCILSSTHIMYTFLMYFTKCFSVLLLFYSVWQLNSIFY